MKVFVMCALFLLSSVLVSADPEAKSIAKKYVYGVTKVLLYDSNIAKEFDLGDDGGYLTRGSGFFVSEDGYLFTNRHVVEWCVYGYMVADWTDESGQRKKMDIITYKEGLEKDPKIEKIYFIGHAEPVVQVFYGSGKDEFHLYKAEVVKLAEEYDGAILRVISDLDGKKINQTFVALPFGDAYRVDMGEDIVILGYPAQYVNSDLHLDLEDTVTMSFGRQSGWDYIFDSQGLIKTDASIHEGNSGGPAFDDSEKVIGIATAMGVKTQIGLIQPINDMYYLVASDENLLKKLQANGLSVPGKKKNFKAVSGNKQPLPKIKLNPLKNKG